MPSGSFGSRFRYAAVLKTMAGVTVDLLQLGLCTQASSCLCEQARLQAELATGSQAEAICAYVLAVVQRKSAAQL